MPRKKPRGPSSADDRRRRPRKVQADHLGANSRPHRNRKWISLTAATGSLPGRRRRSQDELDLPRDYGGADPPFHDDAV